MGCFSLVVLLAMVIISMALFTIYHILSVENITLPCEEYLLQNEIQPIIVPFLPLTKDNVRKCIEKEVKNQRLFPTKEEIEEILGQIAFFGEDFSLLSKNGCKQIPSKVGVFFGDKLNY